MGQGRAQFKMLERTYRIWACFLRSGGRLKEAGFGWMLPGSRGDGDNSTRGDLNKVYPLGWRNEAKLKLYLAKKPGPPCKCQASSRVSGAVFLFFTINTSAYPCAL